VDPGEGGKEGGQAPIQAGKNSMVWRG
jgi:hypothetical protein